jgi:hypothetical protein
MKTLQEMTAAELVAELKELTQDKVVKCMNHSCYHPNPPYLLGGFCEKCGSGQLDARCESAGIKPNLDGTFSIPEFTGTADEMLDYISLLNYFTHKQ